MKNAESMIVKSYRIDIFSSEIIIPGKKNYK